VNKLLDSKLQNASILYLYLLSLKEKKNYFSNELSDYSTGEDISKLIKVNTM
jgi:hypothetical protein